MKKFLLSLVALFMGIGMAVAQEKTVVITGADALWSSTAGKQTGTKEGVTISTTQGVIGTSGGTTQYRAYKNQTFTVSVAEGNITKIELTCTASGTAKEGPGNFTNATSGTYTFSGKVGTWVGSASEVTMTASLNQVRMTEIKVTYQIGESTGPEAVSLALTEASPVQTEYYEGDAFNPEGLVAMATFDDETTADVTAEVAWSYNPANLTVDTKSVEVTAVYKGVSASKTYEVTVNTIANTPETAYTVEEAVDLIDAGNGLSVWVYVKGIVSKVESFDAKYGQITYWISSDGTQESQQFECYCGLNVDGAKFTSIDDVQVGTSLIVYGQLKKYNDTYEFNYKNEIVSVITTGIANVDAAKSAVNGKFIENGRIVIVKDGKKYNLAGQVLR